jgi:hypothetical protein
MNLRRFLSVARTAFALLLTLSLTARAGFTSFNVAVDTSSLNGQMGYLDFQFNPGGAGALAAAATVSTFATDGALQPGAPLNSISGDVSGALPGTLTLGNSTAFNDYFEGVTYGNHVNFELTLSGPAIGNSGTVGSSFAFSLYDSTGSMPLLTTDPFGSVLTVNANADGTTSVETFPQSPNNPTPVATASAVPEPSSLVLAAMVLPVGVMTWRRMRGRSLQPDLLPAAASAVIS